MTAQARCYSRANVTLPGNTVVVALSGGVDSAVAALLLVEAGHRVVGLTLRLRDESAPAASAAGRCCGPADLEDARRVAAHLDIPYYVVDHSEAFAREVVADFVAEYRAGRTPNPCVRCNERIKFGPLLRRARALGAERLATGHYARMEPGADGSPQLFRGVDDGKDQSYFLFAMPREDAAAVLFPLGGMTKEEVRARARAAGLPNAEKQESQEICFVPDGDHAGFVERAGDAAPLAGEFVDGDGEVVGRHAGVHRYTVGQRRGIGLAGAPRYVVSIDALTRRVRVGSREETKRSEVDVTDVRWFGAARPQTDLRALVQVRHRHQPAPAWIEPRGDGARVRFDVGEPAVAPGQAAVFYDEDRVVGGGWIA